MVARGVSTHRRSLEEAERLRPSGPPDISLILNVHNESAYLKRTLMSLEKATRFAQAQGITVELVSVLDQAARSTADWMRAYDFQSFDGHRLCSVDNGSPGPSRNEGIRLARGQYVALCDADDLVSYNFYVEHYAVARTKGQKTIVVPQYCFAFGDNPHLYELFGTDRVSKLAFFGRHPYIARILAPRALFEFLQFCDLPLLNGFAHEDWHFNCEAIAHGCEFSVAEGTILYYRQRMGSVSRLADARSVGKTPFSHFHKPQCFLKTCAPDYTSLVMSAPGAVTHSVRDAFLSNRGCMNLTRAANEIDPAIDIAGIDTVPAYSNIEGDLRPGAIYYQVCKLISDCYFSDVVLMSSLKSHMPHIHQYILGVLDGIKQLRPESAFLVLTTQPSEESDRIPELLEGAVWIDLYRACEGCGDDVLQILTLRLIQAVARGARLHVGSSQDARDFFRRYGRLLDNTRIYYRSYDPTMRRSGSCFTIGTEFHFLSECGEHLDIVITDNISIARHDTARLDTVSHKIRTLYAPREPVGITPRAGSSRRFLLIARSDEQDRLDLLPALARRLEQAMPDARIDVFHQSAQSGLDARLWGSHDNLVPAGECWTLRTLHPERYDALLCLTAADGLPTVILQALSLGLLVIAPDVGGIGEAITKETGFLIGKNADDERLVDAYIQAMARSCDPSNESQVAMRQAGYNLIRTRHSRATFLSRLADLLALKVPGDRQAFWPERLAHGGYGSFMGRLEGATQLEQNWESALGKSKP